MSAGQRQIVLRRQTSRIFAIAAVLLTLAHLFENPLSRAGEAAMWPMRFGFLRAMSDKTPLDEPVVITHDAAPTPGQYATAIEALVRAGAGTIGLDAPTRAWSHRSPEVQRLQQAMRTSGKVVLSAQPDPSVAAETLIWPPEELQGAAKRTGFTAFGMDRGAAARLAMIELTGDASKYGWPLLFLQEYLNVPDYARAAAQDAVTLKRPDGPLVIPLDPTRSIRIRYEVRPDLPRLPLAELLAPGAAPASLAGRAVILPSVGADGSLTVRSPEGRVVSRTAALAAGVRTLVAGRHLRAAPRGLEVGLLLVLALLLALVGWKREPLWTMGAAALAVGLWWFVAIGALASGVVFPLVRPLTLIALLLLAGVFRYRFRTLVGVATAEAGVGDDLQASLTLGIKLMQEGRTDEALKYFQKVAGSQGALASRGNLMLALVLLKKGDRTSVTSVVKRIDADTIPPDEAYRLAEQLEQTGDISNAHTLFSKLEVQDVTYRDVRERLQKLRDRLSGFTEEDVADVIVHKILDARYTDVSLLGRGGMGFVFQAADSGNEGRRVAVKVLSPFYANNRDVYTRFIREAEGIAAMEHPHIIRIFDVFKANLPYYSMEFLTSASLKDIIRTGQRLPLNHTLRITRQICEGLHRAHEMGITHRDIKPDNIMLDESHDAKVIDFGIAHFSDQTQVTQTGHTIGTPKYMSPEQVRGAHIDPRSDIYSLGVVLWELLVGRVPFDNMTEHLVKPVPELPAELEVPATLRTVVRQALQKSPEERFQTMPEMIEAIQIVEAEL